MTPRAGRREVANQRPKLKAEYASTDTQFQETITALNRDLHAFTTSGL